MAKRKISKSTYRNKMNRVRGEYLDNYILLEWGINYIICEHLSPKAHNPLMYVLNRISGDMRIKLYIEIMKENDHLNEAERKLVIKWINHLTEIRNMFAHAMMMLPDLNDFKFCNHFEFHSLGKLFSTEIKVIKYSDSEYNADMDKMDWLINFNQVFLDAFEDEERAFDLETVKSLSLHKLSLTK